MNHLYNMYKNGDDKLDWRAIITHSFLALLTVVGSLGVGLGKLYIKQAEDHRGRIERKLDKVELHVDRNADLIKDTNAQLDKHIKWGESQQENNKENMARIILESEVF